MRKLYLKFYQRYLPRMLSFFGKGLLKLLFRTCRFEISGIDAFIQTASSQKCILMLWHNRLAITGEIFAKHAPDFIYTAFVSFSRDGELLSGFVTSYKQGRIIRVPHDARHKALRDLIQMLRKEDNNIAIVTPDGPRGPLYKVKAGIALAAKASNAAVIPFSWSSDRFWTFNTWDKFMLPKPFATIKALIGPPVIIPDNLSREEESALLEQSLLQLDGP